MALALKDHCVVYIVLLKQVHVRSAGQCRIHTLWQDTDVRGEARGGMPLP